MGINNLKQLIRIAEEGEAYSTAGTTADLGTVPNPGVSVKRRKKKVVKETGYNWNAGMSNNDFYKMPDNLGDILAYAEYYDLIDDQDDFMK